MDGPEVSGQSDFQAQPLRPLERPIDTDPYKEWFNKKRQGIVRTFNAAKRTQNFSRYDEDFNPDELTFEQFLKLSQITPEELAADSQRFRTPGENLDGYVVHTSGSSGVKKEISFSNEGLITTLDPSLIKVINSSKSPIILVDRDSVDSTSHTVLKRSFKSLTTKEMETEGFTFPEEALQAILKRGDTDLVYSYLNPTLVTLLLDGLLELKQRGNPRIESLKGIRFLLETGGDAVDIKQVDDWNRKIDELFGSNDVFPKIMVFYGQSEQLLIGRYDYKPGDQEIRYRVIDKKFCVTYDQDGQPVIGQPGKLEVTNLLKENEPTDGITVLPKYQTGDIASIIKEGEQFYLKDVNRDPERALFSIMGEKIFLDLIPTLLDKRGLGDLKLVFQELHDDSNRRVLKIVTVPRDIGDSAKNASDNESVLNMLLEEYPSLAVPIRTGSLKLVIETGQDSFEKRWRKLPNTQITAAQFDQMKGVDIPEESQS